MPKSRRNMRSHECERGTQECGCGKNREVRANWRFDDLGIRPLGPSSSCWLGRWIAACLTLGSQFQHAKQVESSRCKLETPFRPGYATEASAALSGRSLDPGETALNPATPGYTAPI